MNKEKQDLIDELARKMAVNDLMYDYRIRAITEFADKLEKLFAIPDVVNSVACEHEEKTMQGDGFTYVVCAKCGIDL